jgi:hypothetical protein
MVDPSLPPSYRAVRLGSDQSAVSTACGPGPDAGNVDDLRRRHPRNGSIAGRPIVYALTIPSGATEASWAERYIAFLLGPDGQQILAQNGFATVHPALAVAPDAMPASLRPLVAPWPPA